jgi:Myb/SANT-like DNA-binding domain
LNWTDNEIKLLLMLCLRQKKFPYCAHWDQIAAQMADFGMCRSENDCECQLGYLRQQYLQFKGTCEEWNIVGTEEILNLLKEVVSLY